MRSIVDLNGLYKEFVSGVKYGKFATFCKFNQINPSTREEEDWVKVFIEFDYIMIQFAVKQGADKNELAKAVSKAIVREINNLERKANKLKTLSIQIA
jgi:hypothetical protein